MEMDRFGVGSSGPWLPYPFPPALFGDSQPLVCVVLVTSDMFQGPAKWCCPNGSLHCLDFIKMDGKGIA